MAAILSAAGLSASAQEHLPRFGLGLRASTLGAGIEGATALTRKSNFRAGYNYFSYNDDSIYTKDGVTWSGRLDLRSLEFHYDQYLIGGFHISPGVLIYQDNRASVSGGIAPGQRIELGGVSYFGSASNPATGAGSLTFPKKTAPELLIGFGNLLPRSNRHFAVNFEFGVAYMGEPTVGYSLAGTVCTNPAGTICQPVTDPTVQANIRAEQAKLNHDLRPFKFYPVVALAFGYKF